MSSRLIVKWAPYASNYLGVSYLPDKVSLDKEIGSGGEAVVYSILEIPNALVKLYRTNDLRELQFKENKIKVMIKAKPQEPTPGHITFAWPLGMVYDEQRRFRGFVMPYIKCAIPISSIFDPKDYSWMDKFRKCGVPDNRLNKIKNNILSFKVGVALNLVKAIGYLHAVGHSVGDLNDQNILINSYGLVTLIDTDSFLIKDPSTGVIYPSEVGVGEYTAPEVLKRLIPPERRNENTDVFSLSVIIFKLLMNGYHPFAGTIPSRGSNTIEDNIRDCTSPYFGPNKDKVIRPVGAPDLTTLPPELVNLFERAFNCSNFKRPSIAEFLKAIEKYYVSISIKQGTHRSSSLPQLQQKSTKSSGRQRQQVSPKPQPQPPPPPPPQPQYQVQVPNINPSSVGTSPLLSVEEVKCSQIPISASGKQAKLCYIPAYCNRCKKETIHFVYRNHWGDLYIKCHECGWKHDLGRNIFEFIKMYCPTCKTKTVHAIFKNLIGMLRIKCVGCGREESM